MSRINATAQYADDAWKHGDDDAWMNEKIEGHDIAGRKRRGDAEVPTSPKKSKHGSAKTPTEKQAKEERKQAYQQWMQGDISEVWTQYPSCLVFRFKNGKAVWSTGGRAAMRGRCLVVHTAGVTFGMLAVPLGKPDA